MITSALDLAGLEGGSVCLTAEQFDPLAARFADRFIRPGGAAWNDAVRLWNGTVNHLPSLVLQPTSVEDVVATVAFARDHRLLMSIKGGGHNIAGTALAAGGLTLDMSHMRDVSVDVDARLARVDPGCQLRDVDGATQKHGLATVLGFISEVGVAGLTLGGGLGYLTRRFGWGVDNLEEVEIVTADGRVRTANRTQHPDLFWAVRGGGGNFGVVTRFTLRLHEVGPTVYGGLIIWPFERVDEILGAYQQMTENAPRELAAWLVMLRAPSAPFVPSEWQGRRVCGFAVCFTGDMGAVDNVIAPIRSLADPIVDLLKAQPYVQIQSYLDAVEPKGPHYYWKTGYVKEISGGLMSTLRDLFLECPMPLGETGLLHVGGALNDRAPDDGAVGNRDARFVVGLKGMWDPADERAEAYRRWTRDGWKRVQPFATGGSYINFQTADEDERCIRESYGGNYDRLAKIKATYDPENLFRVNRNVRPHAVAI